ncbi:hypothetical protein KBD61_02185 [Patescibacteria group bacterium]|nr:hypothetical protein [Patescibacteria group bacterium]MBP9709817.1 hypothetical protein [Patescibacteria group bacterium]
MSIPNWDAARPPRGGAADTMVRTDLARNGWSVYILWLAVIVAIILLGVASAHQLRGMWDKTGVPPQTDAGAVSTPSSVIVGIPQD